MDAGGSGVEIDRGLVDEGLSGVQSSGGRLGQALERAGQNRAGEKRQQEAQRSCLRCGIPSAIYTVSPPRRQPGD